MKESDLLPMSASTAAANSTRFRYKIYALVAILLLASSSMLAGTVTLKSSLASSDSDPTADLDVLEMEEREKMVRKMWDVYSHNREIRLPRFWQEAFEAAYEELVDDELQIKEGAISEIARMSVLKILDVDKNTADEKNHPSRGNANVKLSSMLG